MTDASNPTPPPTATATTSTPPKRRRKGWLWSGLVVLLALVAVVVADLAGVINVVKPPQWAHVSLPTVNKLIPHTQPTATATPAPGSQLWKFHLFAPIANHHPKPGVLVEPRFYLQIVGNVAYAATELQTITQDSSGFTEQIQDGMVYAVNVATGKQLWKDAISLSSFRITDGVLYGTADSPISHFVNFRQNQLTFSIYALNPADGTVRWKTALAGEAFGFDVANGVSGCYRISLR